MSNAALGRLCTYGLAWGMCATSAVAASGSGETRAHCEAKRAASVAAEPATCATERGAAHLASLVAAHELTALEIGAGGLDPMRWGDRGTARFGPKPAAPAADAASKSHTNRGCTS